jgi:GNAT superfamily N-acetyltransferase
MLNPDDPMVWTNYAVPTETPAVEDIGKLVEAFEANLRIPRLEFFRDLWPAVPTILEEAGFTLASELPLMVQQKRMSRTYAGVTCRVIDSSLVSLAGAVAEAAFGETDSLQLGPPKARVLESYRSGRWIGVIAFVNGEPAGTGVAVGDDISREAAGIGTLPRFRRRGVASAILDRLAELFLDVGGKNLWLTPGGDDARAVYARAGYNTVGSLVCYERKLPTTRYPLT